MYLIKRFIRKLYRRLWDYPMHWKPYGWHKSEMQEWYWNGFKDEYFND